MSTPTKLGKEPLAVFSSHCTVLTKYDNFAMLHKLQLVLDSMASTTTTPATPAPPPPPASKKRRRVLLATASPAPSNGDDDDGAIDDLLEALGIPDSDKKKKKQKRPEVIELLTPPRAAAAGSTGALRITASASLASVSEALERTHEPPAEARRKSLVDLTSPDRVPEQRQTVEVLSLESSPTSSPRMLSLIATIETVHTPRALQIALPGPVTTPQQAPPQTPPSDHECDAMLADLLLMRPLAERIAAARHPSGVGVAAERETVRASATATPATPIGPSERLQAQRDEAAEPQPVRREPVVALVRMERSLDASDVGRVFKTALETHVHNAKPLAVTLEPPFESALPNVVQWERRERTALANAPAAGRRPRTGASSSNSVRTTPTTTCGLLAAALYFTADAFVELLQREAYSQVLAVVQSLKRDLDVRADRVRQQQQQPVVQLRTFLIVEGMDKCLIALKKKTKKNKDKTTATSPAPALQLAFSDVHELAFQLFMDTETHTQVSTYLLPPRFRRHVSY